MTLRRELITTFVPILLFSIFCIDRCSGENIMRMLQFIALPTPQNMSSLQTTKCNAFGNLLELNRVSKAILGDHDLFYIHDDIEKVPLEMIRLSTVECFEYPDVFHGQKSLLAACKKISKKSMETENPSERNATNISFDCDVNELDCSGVPFAEDLCVPCKSCPAEVTCYVLIGSLLGSYTAQIPVGTEQDAEVCDLGTFGYLCSGRCSRHCVDGDCHHTDGTCLKGCKPGWSGYRCNVPDCPTQKFGPNCKYMCSPNCQTRCDSNDGSCLCKPGWQIHRSLNIGLFCNKPCKPGTWGNYCDRECGDCSEGTVCHPENGTCPNGCNEPGFYIDKYQIDKCDYNGVIPEFTWVAKSRKCQRTRYGVNCQKNCSTACLNSYCRNTDGICLNCPAGYRGPDCSIECTAGTFGDNCIGKCRCENEAVCDMVSGRCPGKCIPGYEGTDCSRRACEPGTYGSECDKWCFCKDNKPCDRQTGKCPDVDCQKGWSFSQCDFRDVCLYPPDDDTDESPISWEPGSLVIGIVIGIVVTVLFVVCRVGYKKCMNV